jgi:hypothetical protein
VRSLAVLLAAALTLLPPIALGHRTYDLVIGVEWSRGAHEPFPRRRPRVPTPARNRPRFLRELGPWLYDIAEQTPSKNARRNA